MSSGERFRQPSMSLQPRHRPPSSSPPLLSQQEAITTPAPTRYLDGVHLHALAARALRRRQLLGASTPPLLRQPAAPALHLRRSVRKDGRRSRRHTGGGNAGTLSATAPRIYADTNQAVPVNKTPLRCLPSGREHTGSASSASPLATRGRLPRPVPLLQLQPLRSPRTRLRPRLATPAPTVLTAGQVNSPPAQHLQLQTGITNANDFRPSTPKSPGTPTSSQADAANENVTPRRPCHQAGGGGLPRLVHPRHR